jgi:hypothetical protein
MYICEYMYEYSMHKCIPPKFLLKSIICIPNVFTQGLIDQMTWLILDLYIYTYIYMYIYICVFIYFSMNTYLYIYTKYIHPGPHRPNDVVNSFRRCSLTGIYIDEQLYIDVHRYV